MSVVVVDYGMGNLRSVAQAVLAVAGTTPVIVSNKPEDVQRAARVVLPGQGAIRDCMRELDEIGLREAVLEAARSKPLLGVCVGMQMLLSHSDEGDIPGLDLIPGQVRRFPAPAKTSASSTEVDTAELPLKVPHIGWNRVAQSQPHPLWQGIDDGAWFYFVHSYYAAPAQARFEAGTTHYGLRFASAVARDNLFATQFHPEKSAADGLRLYANFLHWNP